jgi:hypothetical protein
MSLNEIKKQSQIAGKGHNETLEIVNPLGEQSDAKSVIRDHVPGNGGTCTSEIPQFCIDMSYAYFSLDRLCLAIDMLRSESAQ